MRDLLKCPHCHSPLERFQETSEEIRYRCGVCGKQTSQEKGDIERSGEVLDDSEDVRTD